MIQVPFYTEGPKPREILINHTELTSPSTAPYIRKILDTENLTARSRKRLEAALKGIERQGFEF